VIVLALGLLITVAGVAFVYYCGRPRDHFDLPDDDLAEILVSLGGIPSAARETVRPVDAALLAHPGAPRTSSLHAELAPCDEAAPLGAPMPIGSASRGAPKRPAARPDSKPSE
jgi:hypothetical protein